MVIKMKEKVYTKKQMMEIAKGIRFAAQKTRSNFDEFLTRFDESDHQLLKELYNSKFNNHPDVDGDSLIITLATKIEDGAFSHIDFFNLLVMASYDENVSLIYEISTGEKLPESDMSKILGADLS